VIGIGNPLRGDDAIGLLVARRVRELVDPRWRIELEGEPARLIDAWQGAGLAVVVDAVKTGAPPGTVIRIDATADPQPRFPRHRRTPLVLGRRWLARALDRLPEHLIVFGIEGSGFQPSSDLSSCGGGD
jgi:hydrogenase maturation protease